MSRAARARAVLQAAEQLHGVSRLALVPASAASVSSVPVEQRPAAAQDEAPVPLEGAFAVPSAFAQILPQGLPRGAVCCVQGSTALLLALAAHVSAQDGWVAFVGMADLNFVAALDLGMDLSRVVVIPEPGGQVPEIMATLIDGMDLVVTAQRVGLTSAQQSRLSARARERGTTLLVAGAWPQARLHISGQAGAWQGAKQGLGRLTTCSYRLQRGTSAHGFKRVDVQLHNGRFQAVAQHTALRLLA